MIHKNVNIFVSAEHTVFQNELIKTILSTSRYVKEFWRLKKGITVFAQ